VRAELTLEEVKRAAKREDFRAGVQMRVFMPRLSVRVTRWVLARSRVSPNQITLASLAIGLAAAAAFASTSPWIVALGLAAFHVHVLLDYVDGEVARCRGLESVRGAYLDLMTDRVTFPLLVFGAAFGAYRAIEDAAILVAGFFGAFGLLADKEACDCWYRANAGRPDIEDRYMPAPERDRWGRWRGRLSLAAVMSRSLPAFLGYTTLAAVADDAGLAAPVVAGSYRALLVWLCALSMPAGALARFLYVYWRGAIPRRQHLL
jgi:phosphatidylglycerophosphate synthase